MFAQPPSGSLLWLLHLMRDSKGFRGDETTYIGTCTLSAGTAGESDGMLLLRYYIKLPAQESQHLYGSTKYLRDSQSLLEASVHSVVLLPQDTPCMAGCYGQPPALLPLLECLFVCLKRRGGRRGWGVAQNRGKERGKAGWWFWSKLAVRDETWLSRALYSRPFNGRTNRALNPDSLLI